VTLALRTARNTLLVMTARVISKLLVFVVVLIVIRSTGQANYGKFTSLVVYSALVSIIADLGLRPLFTREVAKDRRLMTPYLNSILSLKLVLALPVFIVLYAAVSIGLPQLVPYVVPTFVLLLTLSFANQLRAAFYATARLRFEAVAILGESIVLLAAAALVSALRLPWWAFIWAYALSYGFTVVYATVMSHRSLGHRFAFDLDWRRLSGLARESLPFGLAVIISTLYFKIDVPILKAFTNFSAVGIYGAAYKFLEAIAFIPQTLMDPIFPALAVLAHEHRDRLQGATSKVYKLLAAVGVPVAVVLVVFAAPIIGYTIPGFESAAPVLRVLGLGALFLFVNNAFIYTLNAMGRQSDATRLAALSLVLNVVLNLVLIPQKSALYGGYMGAAWATVLTEVALFGGGWVLLRRHLFALPMFRTISGILPAGLLSGAVTAAIVFGLGPRLAVYVLALLAGAVAYAGGLWLMKAFTAEELTLAREATRSLARR